MPCYKPLKGYRAKTKNPSGKYSITFNVKQGYLDMPMQVPCGQCIGCRLERSRQWAMRCMHEASLHRDNAFLTLTFNNENLNENGTLVKRDFQLFMKRYRKKFPHLKIRYYHCGEYGDMNKRPHHHAIIFGHDFQDKYLWQVKNGNNYYRSETLEELWPHGYCIIGGVTFDSAAYVARYILKKRTGKNVGDHYEVVNKKTGEVNELLPEYTTMSRRPGIAREWYEKYKDDVFPSDEVSMNGKLMKPPKYYDSLYEVENPEEFKYMKGRRKQLAKENACDNTPDRLEIKEACKTIQTKQLIRSYENEENIHDL